VWAGAEWPVRSKADPSQQVTSRAGAIQTCVERLPFKLASPRGAFFAPDLGGCDLGPQAAALAETRCLARRHNIRICR
jgi:hypothetical protein